eukprot:5240046-Alexandrium_andersonii.AAC.1
MAVGTALSGLPPLPGRSPRVRAGPGSLRRPGVGPRVPAVPQASIRAEVARRRLQLPPGLSPRCLLYTSPSPRD